MSECHFINLVFTLFDFLKFRKIFYFIKIMQIEKENKIFPDK